MLLVLFNHQITGLHQGQEEGPFKPLSVFFSPPPPSSRSSSSSTTGRTTGASP